MPPRDPRPLLPAPANARRVVPWPGLAGAVMLLAGAAAITGADPQDRPAYDAKHRRDPFAPLVRDGQLVGISSEEAFSTASSSPAPAVTLAGILWDPAGRSVALINGTEVKAGDLVGAYRVVEIRPNAVVLDHEGQQRVVQMVFDGPRKAGSPADAPPTGGEGRGE